MNECVEMKYMQYYISHFIVDFADDEANQNLATEEGKSVETGDFQGSSVDPPQQYPAKSAEMADVGIHKSNKYEELIKKQLSQTNSFDAETNRSNLDRSDAVVSGRRTPIGDVAKETFQDGGDTVYMKQDGDLPLSRGDRPLSRGSLNVSLVEDEVERPSSVHSGLGIERQIGSVGRQTPQNSSSVDEFFRSENREQLRSAHSSARQTPQADVFASEGRVTPLRSGEHSLNGSVQGDVKLGSSDLRSPHASISSPLRPASVDVNDAVGDILGNDVTKSPLRSAGSSLPGSARQTPRSNFIDDVLGQTTPIARSEHSSAPVTPRQLSARNTPQITDTLRTSQERPYSHGGSRPQSLTSEQELNQYFENGVQQGSIHGSLPGSTHGSNRSESRRTPSVQASPALQTSERTHSSSSLPVITTQQRLLAEKRSMTPDNHIRVPGDVSPAVGTIAPANIRSSASSRASDRTLTPTPARVQENGYREVRCNGICLCILRM